MNKCAAALLSCSVLFCLPSMAAERETVCAKYETRDGWSKNYKVQATILTGSELNQKTRSIDYTAFSKYVVIFWDEGQASIIEMDMPYLSYVGLEGKDQRGRKWEVSKGNSYCF